MSEARTLIVDVTDGHIAAGVRCSENACPVALAIYRAAEAMGFDVVPGSVGVAQETLRLREYTGDGVLGPETGPTLKAKMPAAVGTFIYRFDRGAPVKPFTFRIELPSEKT